MNMKIRNQLQNSACSDGIQLYRHIECVISLSQSIYEYFVNEKPWM